tara:strand:- start:11286 stop:12611 length:1326 start_codon:yes stop_codon:yes gene_type:complete
MLISKLARALNVEIVLCALLIIAYAITLSAPLLLLVVLAGIACAVLLPFGRSIQLAFFLLPCSEIFTQSPYIAISLLTFIFLAMFGRYLLTHVFATQFSQPGLLLMLLVLLYELMHVIYNPVMLSSKTVRWAIFFIFTSLLLFDKNKYCSFSQLRFALLCGVIVSTLYGLLQSYFGPISMSSLTVISRFSGGAGDPNNFGLFCLLLIYFYLPTIPREKIPSTTYAIILLMLVFGALTVSRSFFIVATLSLLTYFIFYYRSALGDMFVRLLISFNGVLILIALYWFSGASFIGELAILSRFSGDNLSDLTGSRSDILQEYIRLFFALPYSFVLFGAGINGYLGYYNFHFLQSGLFPEVVGPHNTLLEIMISFGLVGFALFAAYLYLGFRAERNRTASQHIFRLAWLPIIVFILYCFSLQNLGKYGSYLILMLIVYNTYRKDS